MPRTVSAHNSSQQSFSSHENFAGLLDRLTQRVHGDTGTGKLSDDDLPPVRTPAFSSDAFRKQAMVPVARLKPKTDRLRDEATELSYEKALRLHRRKDPDLGSAPEAESPASKLACDPPAQSPSLPMDAKPVRNSRSKPAGVASPVASHSAESQPALASQNAPNRRSAAQYGKQGGEKRTIHARPNLHKSKVADKAKISAGKTALRNVSLGDSEVTRTGKVAAGKSAIPQTAKTASAGRRRHAPSVEPSRMLSAKNAPVPELGLQISSKQTHLEHRHAIVSIRLNDAEFDRLKLRAAESGISVSAYMRSCVLDAEHLRSQVKEALNQMRASLQAPLAPERPPAQLASPLPVLSSTQNRSGGAWSRLLSKSATFFLGPWFPYRHRA